jgi:phosphatidylethanolamine/phosphatidyl-N-methylethanolamine N-methyltransferase
MPAAATRKSAGTQPPTIHADAPAPTRTAKSHTVMFAKQFLRSPATIGAIMPSSRYLAHATLEGVDWERAQTVVEFGPGAGAITGHIIKHLSPRATFFALEMNPSLARELRANYPGVRVFTESAAAVGRACETVGVPAKGGVDVIISGLPWASFPEGLQREILGAALEALRPGGTFVTFGYYVGLLTSAGKRFRRVLGEHFPVVQRSQPVWLNFPTAFVYRCRKAQ